MLIITDKCYSGLSVQLLKNALTAFVKQRNFSGVFTSKFKLLFRIFNDNFRLNYTICPVLISGMYLSPYEDQFFL